MITSLEEVEKKWKIWFAFLDRQIAKNPDLKRDHWLKEYYERRDKFRKWQKKIKRRKCHKESTWTRD